ncbi:MAG: PH domain-containing protein [Oscillospiraceae bacterium]
MKKISMKGIFIWSIRYMLISLSVLFVVILSLSFSQIASLITLISFIIITGIVILVIFPLRYKKLSFSYDREFVIFKFGILFSYTSIMETKNVKYVTIISTPLMLLFGLRTVVLKAAGARIIIPQVKKEEAEKINKLIIKLK